MVDFPLGFLFLPLICFCFVLFCFVLFCFAVAKEAIDKEECVYCYEFPAVSLRVVLCMLREGVERVCLSVGLALFRL